MNDVITLWRQPAGVGAADDFWSWEKDTALDYLRGRLAVRAVRLELDSAIDVAQRIGEPIPPRLLHDQRSIPSPCPEGRSGPREAARVAPGQPAGVALHLWGRGRGRRR